MNNENYTDDKQTLQTAEDLFMKATQQELNRKYGNEKTKVACLKIAARQEQELLKNADNLPHFQGHALQGTPRQIAKELNEYAPPYNAEVYLQKFENDPDFTTTQLLEAEALLAQVEDSQRLVGKKPSAKAAAAVHIAGILTGNYMSNLDIVEKAGISEPTLRKSYTIMVEELELRDEILDLHPYPKRTKWAEAGTA